MTNAPWRIITETATTDYTSKQAADDAAYDLTDRGVSHTYQRYNQFTGQWDEQEEQ